MLETACSRYLVLFEGYWELAGQGCFGVSITLCLCTSSVTMLSRLPFVYGSGPAGPFSKVLESCRLPSAQPHTNLLNALNLQRPTSYTIMTTSSGSIARLLVLGVLFHLVYIGTVFDCYFTSPVVHGMRQYKLPRAQAKRLVLIVGAAPTPPRIPLLTEAKLTSHIPHVR